MEASLIQQQQVSKPTMYAYTVNVLILLIFISNQWGRYGLPYLYSYDAKNGTLVDKNNDKYIINDAYPKLADNYGLLAGAAFAIPIAFVGLYGGVVADASNRTVALCVACIFWSGTLVISGTITNFYIFALMRILLGIFEAFCNPCAYSLISDYFHPDHRGFANSIFTMGIYVGGALSSLTITICGWWGWKLSYQIQGYFGIGAAVIGLLVIKEPQRYAFETPGKRKELLGKPTPNIIKGVYLAMIDFMINPTCRWVLIGGCFRFFGGYAIGFFMPSYFGKVYPDQQSVYSVLNAFVVAVCGFLSSLGGGTYGDKYESVNFRSKAHVCIFASVLGIPTMALCVLYQKNFYVSILGLALEYLTAECWFAPAITMVLNTITPSNKGYAVSTFMLFTTLSGTFSSWLLGKLAISYNVDDNPGRYGYILFIFVCISYGGALPFFWMAGNSYTEFKEKEQKAKEEEEQHQEQQKNLIE